MKDGGDKAVTVDVDEEVAVTGKENSAVAVVVQKEKKKEKEKKSKKKGGIRIVGTEEEGNLVVVNDAPERCEKVAVDLSKVASTVGTTVAVDGVAVPVETLPVGQKTRPEQRMRAEGVSSVDGPSAAVMYRNKEADTDGDAKPSKELEQTETGCIFTDAELDAMEECEPGQEATVLAGAKVNTESEEYDKELEGRLYPLDDAVVLERVRLNTEAVREPSIAELSRLLGISPEVLERTRRASPGKLASPEHWQDWFRKTLETTEEAKRANRDFKTPVVNAVRTAITTLGRSSPSEKLNEGRENPRRVEDRGEDDVCANILLPAVETDAGEEDGRLSRQGDSSPVVDHRGVRATGRTAAYRWLKECLEAGSATASTPGEDGPTTDGVQPRWDEAPTPDWQRLRALAEREAAGPTKSGIPWGHLETYLIAYLEAEGALVWTKLLLRAKRGRNSSARRRERRRTARRMDVSTLFEPTAGLCELLFYPEDEDDASHYVEVVRPSPRVVTKVPKTGLVEVVTVELPGGFGVSHDDVRADVHVVVEDGRRVVCAVGNFEALSSGYIECLPSRMLADTGATLSLVDSRVLKRLGRSQETLEPYGGQVKSSSGHPLKIRGWIGLSLRLGTVEVSLSVLVADKLHVDAILGVDALGAFGAVIDVAERRMTLKDTGEELPLGYTVVQDAYMAQMAASIRLPPRGQALVMANVVGDAADKTTVLVESTVGLSPTLCVARTLCTVENGQVLVEVCNASSDVSWVKKGSTVACVSVIPESAFGSPSPSVPTGAAVESTESQEAKASSASGNVELVELEKIESPEPTVPPDKEEKGEADFSQSKLTDEQIELFREELIRFDDLFVTSSMKPGRTDRLKFEIDTGDNKPIKQPPYRVSMAEGEVMEAEVQQYLDLGLIRPSNSPWASPVLMIRKPDGGICFCIDYRKLNDCYPMPLIDDILDVLGGAQIFSTMDIASGYWNVPMDEGSVAKTAFTCKFGLYEWLVMPFGLCNAVPAFERLMETVLVDLKWRVCLVYLDDCVIFSKDFPTHLVRVRQVLTRFREAGFKLKMKKCHWGRSQVAFLGHIVTPAGILPSPEKVKAVMNIRPPRDLHEIRSFLGLTSYFRRYIPGYAAISAPLERLKAKDAPFEWNEDCEASFRQLKRALMKPPILAYPDGRRRFKLFVDSSRYAVGTCLMQEVDGRDRVVAYASKLLTGSQKN